MKIVSIVGKKNTGKTTLTTKIIEKLTKKGYKVASIKHTHHTIEMDKENTDTWKHKNAGAEIVVGVGSTTFFNITTDLELNRILFLLKHQQDLDYIIIEGFKSYNYPKIITSPDVRDEYTISEVDAFTLKDSDIEDLINIIDEKTHDMTDTLFANNCGYNDSKTISEQIRKGELKTTQLDKTHSYLSIDGKVVGLNRFVSDYLKENILGIIKTLNLTDYDINEINDIEVIIPNKSTLTPTKGNVNLEINDEKIELNQFTNKILTNSINAMINSLKTPKNIEKIEINLTHNSIDININKQTLEINKFTKNLLRETIYAIISSLKTPADINEIKIKMIQ